MALNVSGSLATPEAGQVATELRSVEQVFRLVPKDDGLPLFIGRRAPDTGHTPDIDLGELIGGRTVSRRQAWLTFRDDAWYIQTEPESTNLSLLNDEPLAAGQEVALRANDRLQFGRVELTFNQYRVTSSDYIELNIETDEIVVSPSEPQQVMVTLTNHTGRVERFQIEIAGLPPSWYRIYLPDGAVTAPVVYLLNSPAGAVPIPQAQQRFRLLIQPPREATSTAGTYPFEVIATTTGEPPQRGVTTAKLHVQSFEEMALAITPDELRGSAATFEVQVHNQGNSTSRVVLKASGEGMLFEWDHPDAETGVLVPNGVVMPFLLTAAIERRPWGGVEIRHNFWVSAVAGVIEPPPVRAQLIVTPRIPMSIQSMWTSFYAMLSPIIMLVLILLFAYLFIRPPDIQDFKQSTVLGRKVTLTAIIDRPCVAPRLEGGPSDLVLRPAAGSKDPSTCGFFDVLTSSFPWVAKPVTWQDDAVLQKEPLSLVVSASNFLGIATSRNLGVPAVAVPKIISFTANPPRLNKETDTIDLTWQTDGANAVKLIRIDVGGDGDLVPRDLNIPITTVSGAASDSVRQGTSDYLFLAAISDEDPTPESLERIKIQCEASLEEYSGCVEQKSRLASAARKFDQCKPKLLNREPCDLQDVVMLIVRVVVNKPLIDSFKSSVEAINPAADVQLNWETQNATQLSLLQRSTPSAAAQAQAPGRTTAPVPSNGASNGSNGASNGSNGASNGSNGASNASNGSSTVKKVSAAPSCAQAEEVVQPLDIRTKSFTVQPRCDTEYVLRATNAGGTTEQSIKVKVTPIQIMTFTAAPEVIGKGEQTVLTWNIVGAGWLELSPGGVVGPSETSRVVKPERTTVYTLIAYGPNRTGDPTSQTLTVTVGSAPVKLDFFLAQSPVVTKGQSTALIISAQNATRITITTGDKAVVLDEAVTQPSIQRNVTVTPQDNTVYILTIRNESGMITAPVTVTVNPPPAPATFRFPVAGVGGAIAP